MLRSKSTTVPIGAILLILLPLVSGKFFESIIAQNGLDLFGAVSNSFRPQQHLSVDNGERTTPPTTQQPNDNETTTTSCPHNLTDVLYGCYDVYMHQYGFVLSPFLPPFDSFLDKVENSTALMKRTCRIFNWLHHCIERDVAFASMPDCVNGKNLAVMSLTSADAIQYSAIFAGFEYICGQGYEVFQENERCLIDYGTNETVIEQIELCGLENGLGNTTDICNLSVIPARCADQVFGDLCGTTLGIAMCGVQANMARFQPNILNSTCVERILDECSFDYNTTISSNVTNSLVEQMTTPLQPLAPAP